MAHILIVDDEVHIRKMLNKALSLYNHSILEASNGEAALDIIKHQHIDIVIIDLVMPQKGGLETVMDIRQMNKKVKLIAISGKIPTDSHSLKALTQQFQVDSVIAKPLDIDEMIRLIDEMS